MGKTDEDPRDQLIEVGDEVVRAGLVVGSGGNLSARIPGTDDIWVTATGTWLNRLGRSDFVAVGVANGAVHRSVRVPPTSELLLHLATYRRRPDIAAVVHLHPQTVLLLDALGERIRLVTTDHAYYLRRIITVPFRRPGTAELADEAAAATADGTDCVILAHHGCSVLADSVGLAHKRALYLEEAARLTYRALLLGRADTMADCPAEFTRAIDQAAGTGELPAV
jgi:L-fuculose-phosphate aldolase